MGMTNSNDIDVAKLIRFELRSETGITVSSVAFCRTLRGDFWNLSTGLDREQDGKSRSYRGICAALAGLRRHRPAGVSPMIFKVDRKTGKRID